MKEIGNKNYKKKDNILFYSESKNHLLEFYKNWISETQTHINVLETNAQEKLLLLVQEYKPILVIFYFPEKALIDCIFQTIAKFAPTMPIVILTDVVRGEHANKFYSMPIRDYLCIEEKERVQFIFSREIHCYYRSFSSSFRNIFSNNLQGILITNKEGKIVECNDTALKLLEISRERLLASSPEDYIGHILNIDLKQLSLEELPITKTVRTRTPIVNQTIAVKLENRIMWHKLNTELIYENSTEELSGALIYFQDITNHQETIQALEESEEFISSVFNAVNEGILVSNERGKIETANSKIYEIFGYPQPDLIGKDLNCIVENSQDIGDSKRENFVGIKLNGNKFPISVSKTKTSFQTHKIEIFVIKDITMTLFLEEEKRKSEQKLKTKEIELREMMLNVPGVIFQLQIKGKKFRLNFVSPKLEEIFRIEYKNKTILKIIKSIKLFKKKNFLSNLRSTILARKTINIECNFTNSKKRDFYTNIIASPYPINEKEVIYNGVMIDITDRKDSAKRLEDQKQLFRSLFNFSPIGKSIMDMEGGFYSGNYALADISGYSTQELQFMNILDLLPQTEWEEERKRLEKLKSGSQNELKVEHIIIRKNKTERRVFRHIVVLFDNEGKIIFSICAFLDVTEQRELEEKLTQSKKMESVGNFASSIAHDFNNLLQPVILFSGMLLNELKAGSQNIEFVSEGLEKIYSTANRAKKLVNQILEFSRKGAKSFFPMDLVIIIKDSIETMRSTFEKAKIQVSLELSQEKFIVNTDPLIFHQIMLNLFTNSIHALMNKEDGRILIRLEEISLRSLGKTQFEKFYLLRFEDNGKGITEEKLPHIFEPFYTDKRGEGTGLGLAIVYGAIKRMGGEIEVHSVPNVGTTFKITLLPYAEV